MIFEGLLNIPETVTFVMFIYEESLQTLGLGIFIALRHRNNAAARRMVIEMETRTLPEFKGFMDNYGWLAVYSVASFQAFYRASYNGMQMYKEVLGM